MDSRERRYWLSVLERLALPVLTALAEDDFHARFNFEGPPGRRKYAVLEAAARLLTGIAPWLELVGSDGAFDPAEKELGVRIAELSRRALAVGVNPKSSNAFNFDDGDQPLVDAGFLAHAVIRAPIQLWRKLDRETQTHLVQGLKRSRSIVPYYCNWLLFSAVVETALFVMGAEYDAVRVDYALRQHEQWYLGDGVYGDGPQHFNNYYNSFVIQPMLLDITRILASEITAARDMAPSVLERAQIYAGVQERMIAPDGSFPPLGRSLAYRCGAFQLLAQMALLGKLPQELEPAQVRTALTAVIRRTMDAEYVFDEQGWLTIGLCGHQPQIGEPYISNASCYLSAAALLPLGLPESDPFWSGPAKPYTSQKLWS